MGLAYKQVFENNRRWMAEKSASDSNFFVKLSGEQQPDYLYIGCSDSRVPAEIFMGAQPGEVFVHRNVANLVDPSDRNAMGVIQFAVTQLKVEHIVVCGHYMCGGIQAAMEQKIDEPLDSWLRQIRGVAGKHRDELEGIDDLERRYRRLVELNVEVQCTNVLGLQVVQEAIGKNDSPTIHGWVYEMHTGRLIDLDFQY